MIYVISRIKFISELNLKFMPNGSFVVKNIGMLFQNIASIPTEGQENQKNKILSKFKLIELNICIPKKKFSLSKIGSPFLFLLIYILN